MPFQAVATQRLYEQVAGQVTDLVARGEFKPGDRLPPERDLAKAARRQPSDGARGDDRAGNRRPGRSAGRRRHIRHRQGQRMARRTAACSRARFLAARADRGAAHHRAGSRGTRRAARDAGRNRRHRRDDRDDRAPRRTRPTHRAADHQFHVRIGLASHNTMLTAIVDECWAEMYSPMFERMGAITGLIASRCSPQQRDKTVAEHGPSIAPSRRTIPARRAPRWTAISPASSASSIERRCRRSTSRPSRTQPGAAA